MSPAPPPASRTQHWLWPLLLLLGSVTLAIAWLMVALSTGSQAGWMAIAAAALKTRIHSLQAVPLVQVSGQMRRGKGEDVRRS